MRIPKNATLSGTLTALGAGAIFYQFITYSGLYRLASELQLLLFGIYWPYLSLAAAGVICLAPGALTQPPPGEDLDPGDELPTWEQAAVYKASRTIRRLKVWLPALAVGVAAPLLYAQTLPAGLPNPVTFDPAHITGSPPLGAVTMKPMPELGQAIVLESFGRDAHRETYLPVVLPGAEGQVGYVLHLSGDDVAVRNELDKVADAGAMTGTLERGVNGEAQAGFERAGLHMAPATYTLSPGIVSVRGVYYLVSIVCGLIMAVLLIIMLLAVRRRRKYGPEAAAQRG